MKIETVLTLVMIAVAIAAGLGNLSFAWALIPAFFAGALSLSNGPHYQSVVAANKRGVIWYFPSMLAIHVAGKLIFAAAAFGITTWIA